MLPTPSQSISQSPSPPPLDMMTVLERQKAALQRLYHNQENHHSTNDYSHQYNQQQILLQGQMINSLWPHHHLNPPFTFPEPPDNVLHNSSSSSIFMTTIVKSDPQCNSDAFSNGHASSLKKRKAEYDVEEEDVKGKGAETEIEAEKSEITTTKTNERENSSSANNCYKVKSDVQKTDYIHVRARRGQATDSHSLAERARREKISKKMKCLQDLVPGCNKVTGKAGMLDEIINYVQSLQKQVEFLSMKLATINPRLDFNMDSFLAKESPAYIASLQAASQIEASNSLQLMSQMHSNFGLDFGLDQSQKAGSSSSMPIPETFLDSSSTINPQIQQLSGWESDWPNLFNVSFN